MFGRKKVKHIKTQKIIMLERIDRAALLIPVAIFGWILYCGREGIMKDFETSFHIGLATVFLFFLLTAAIYLPPMLIWKSVSYTMKKNAIAQTSFIAIEDFDYYRDELTGISPATISMCVDYAIERDKDITAQLLKFTMLGLIETDGNQITILQTDVSKFNLSPSETFLLNKISTGEFNRKTAEYWEKLAENEVLSGPYIQSRKKKKKIAPAGCTGCLGCLPFFILMGLSTYVLNSSFINLLDSLDETMSNEEFFNIIISEPKYILSILIFIFFAVAVFVSFVLPIVITLSSLTKNKVKSPYIRTKEGEVLMEEIYGLKNFIHDFSDLENAEKEALVLWDDFLIYAVLLEENTSIVNEITSMRNLKIINTNNMK